MSEYLRHAKEYFCEVLRVRRYTYPLILVCLAFFSFLDFSGVFSKFIHAGKIDISGPQPLFYVACALCVLYGVALPCKYLGKRLLVSLDCSIDQYFYIVFVSLSGYVTVSLLRLDCPWWLLSLITAGGAAFTVILNRIAYYRDALERTTQYNANFYDLKDIYANVISEQEKDAKQETDAKQKTVRPILLSDKAAAYDLLDRKHIIESLFGTIAHYRPQSSFVVGLEGEWGGGKSTIINIVKRMLKEQGKSTAGQDYIIIDSFNPWLYSDNETFLLGMFDAILENSGINYSVSRSRRTIAAISELLSKNDVTSCVGALLDMPRKLSDTVQDIKDDINRYLESSDKVIVFFIDDVDRTLPENVIFLFKILSVVLDLKKTIYVLSYDPVQLSKILSDGLNVDPKFIEKIVQMKIKVDVPSASMKDVYETCLGKILSAYGESCGSKDYAASISHICSSIANVREFKRFVNSALYTMISQGDHLYKPDLLAIEYIKYSNNELYQKLFNNKQFLVSHDIDCDIDVYAAQINQEIFTKLHNEFVEEIEQDAKNARYIGILRWLFPDTLHKDDDSAKVFGRKKKDSEVAKNARICSARFFGLYFTYASNEYITIKNKVLNFVSKISEDIDIDTASHIFEDNIKRLTPYWQDIWIANFRLFTEDASKDKALFIAKMLFNSVYQISGDPGEWFSSPRRKAVVYLSELLLKVDEKSLDDFVELAVRSYSKLEVVWQLEGYLSDTDSEGTVFKRIYQCLESMCRSVVGENSKEKINLYADEYYHFHNIRGLMSFYKDDPDTLRRYILDVAAEDNIYRILGDFVSYIIGRGFSYFISPDIYNLLLDDSKGIDLTSKLDELLDKRPAETESEKLVLEIYKGRETVKTEIDRHGAVLRPEIFHFDL